MNKQTNKQVKLYSLKETHFRSKDTHKLKGKKRARVTIVIFDKIDAKFKTITRGY